MATGDPICFFCGRYSANCNCYTWPYYGNFPNRLKTNPITMENIDNKDEILDFLGTPIKIGDRGIRAHGSSYSSGGEFVKITITKIRPNEKQCIGFISDGNDKTAYTYPRRIIIQNSI